MRADQLAAPISRRRMLQTGFALGGSVLLLAACGPSAPAAPPSAPAAPTGAAPKPAAPAAQATPAPAAAAQATTAPAGAAAGGAPLQGQTVKTLFVGDPFAQ